MSAMIAAIYARKSTEQTATEEQKSVARQVAIAREYAKPRGWTIAESSIWTDDSISGAEFVKRPGFTSLMDAIRSTPRFEVLILYDLSRLGRDQFHTLAALKDIVEAGVSVAQVMEDRTITPETLDDEVEVLILQVKQFSNTKVRRDASKKVYDTLKRKAEALHCTGGRCYGYDNQDVTEPGPDGRPRRVYVKRVINPKEAEAVMRLFTLYAQGAGYQRTARRLAAEGFPPPKPSHRDRPPGWSPTAVREMLANPLYSGRVVWGRRKKIIRRGTESQEYRHQSEWLERDAADLRIIPDDLWKAVQARRQDARHIYLRHSNGRLWGKPPNGIESQYLLTGFVVCGLCGAALGIRGARHGRRPAYKCLAYETKGPKACANRWPAPMKETDAAVLSLLADTVLRPEVMIAAIEEALKQLRPSVEKQYREQERLRAELARVETQLKNLGQAILDGMAGPTTAALLKEGEQKRDGLNTALDGLNRLSQVITDLDTERLTRSLRDTLEDWRGLLARHPQQARQILRTVLAGRLAFTPQQDGSYTFQGAGRLAPVLTGHLKDGLPQGAPMRLGPGRSYSPLVGRTARFSLSRAALPES